MKFRLSASLLLTAVTAVAQVSVLKPAAGMNGMVVSSDSLATSVGVQIMKDGGNAVDAAVAVGFALAVTYPQAGNLGGGGYIVVHLANGENHAIDARETAPSAAATALYLDSAGNPIPQRSLSGGLAAGVPGNVDGLILAEEKWGRLGLKKVIAPAVQYAANGFVMGRRLAMDLAGNFLAMQKYPPTFRYFTRNGVPYRQGELFRQPDLAEVLKKIGDHGREGFYSGEIPALIARADRNAGGVMTPDDLERYHARIAQPVTVLYRGYRVVAVPPSSSGGICLAEILNTLSHFDLHSAGFGSSQSIHLEAEALRRAFADRARWLGDDAFTRIPLELLTSADYAAQLAAGIDTFRATPSRLIYPDLITPPPEGVHTTHYSVADREGNAAAVTTTLNSYFGSLVAVDGAGFLLNNEMDDFSIKPGVPNQFGAIGSDANGIQPGKRMLSSMSPTILLKEDKPFLILGAPGGTTIICTVLQVILNIVDFDMPLVRAELAGRIHQQWLPDEVLYEKGTISRDVLDHLSERGYRMTSREYLGEVQTILVTPEGFEGVADPRGNGTAEGF
ncbi:MAG TPA: gamma-glutamyltransferase [Bacteroidota bacterium]|nr:gamma-glutamyltransferase [Bacteroidota bacterium]